MSSVVTFFFQADDGIRDFHVTGVQTCALPICPPRCGRDDEEGRVGRRPLALAPHRGGRAPWTIVAGTDREGRDLSRRAADGRGFRLIAEEGAGVSSFLNGLHPEQRETAGSMRLP